ncbi:MAG: GNAT family N-acetyltransferase [Spirochaetes bacterium]|nr:GNAT family N-acetyltransferase [Spirochaetota bacterium]
MIKINLRKIIRDNAEEIHRIDSICFPAGIAYSFTEFTYLLKHINQAHTKGIKGFIIEVNSKTSGFIIARQNKERSEIITIDILPEFREKGYGEKLLNFMEQFLIKNMVKYIFLEVAVNNEPAVNLYTKLGYKILKKIDAYYPGNIPAFVMRKKI